MYALLGTFLHFHWYPVLQAGKINWHSFIESYSNEQERSWYMPSGCVFVVQMPRSCGARRSRWTWVRTATLTPACWQRWRRWAGVASRTSSTWAGPHRRPPRRASTRCTCRSRRSWCRRRCSATPSTTCSDSEEGKPPVDSWSSPGIGDLFYFDTTSTVESSRSESYLCSSHLVKRREIIRFGCTVPDERKTIYSRFSACFALHPVNFITP